MRSGRLLREEEVLVTAAEHLRRAAGRLDVQHPVSLGDRRSWEVQQRGERPEQQVDLVLLDQRVVVGDDRVLVRGVVLDDYLDWPAQESALLVHEVAP